MHTAHPKHTRPSFKIKCRSLTKLHSMLLVAGYVVHMLTSPWPYNSPSLSVFIPLKAAVMILAIVLQQLVTVSLIKSVAFSLAGPECFLTAGKSAKSLQ